MTGRDRPAPGAGARLCEQRAGRRRRVGRRGTGQQVGTPGSQESATSM
jgi:hypothetical protein